MDALSIILWDDPRLSKVCEKLDDNEFGPELEEFGHRLRATMDKANGIGLAAVQVGVLKRMFVMRFPDHEKTAPIVVCNPTLALSGPMLAEREGCLSLPQIYISVPRASHVDMTYREPNGKHVELLLDLWDARVAQHEFDHTMGVFFLNRVSRQVRRAALRDWEKEKRKRGL